MQIWVPCAVVKLPSEVDAGKVVMNGAPVAVVPPDDDVAPPFAEEAPPLVDDAPPLVDDAPAPLDELPPDDDDVPPDAAVLVLLPPQPAANANATTVPRLSSRICLMDRPSLFSPYWLRARSSTAPAGHTHTLAQFFPRDLKKSGLS